MKRNRFELILQCLHFGENVPKNNDNNEDRLYKVRSLTDMLMENFRAVLNLL